MDDKKFSAAVDLLAESWRLAHFTEKFADGADDKLRKKISNQVTRFNKHFHTAAEIFGLEVVDFTGDRFKSGGTVSALRRCKNFSD